MRRIVHVDMDAFYAAIEQRDDSTLRNKPVVVGGDPNSRGVVSTCSYEARKFGIHSAMPTRHAKRLCPHAIFLYPDFKRYRHVASKVHAIFKEYTSLVEPISLDEAFLDVTEERGGLPTATAVAQEIRMRIYDELHLTASAGVAPIKFVAKIASDHRKPNGLVVVQPDQILNFLHPLPVKKLWGVGPVTAEKIEKMGITTIGQLAQTPKNFLSRRLGESLGNHLWQLAHGIDERPVVSSRTAKSHSAEETFSEDLNEMTELEVIIQDLCERVTHRLKKHSQLARTISIKVRFHDFKTVTRSQTLHVPTNDYNECYEICITLLEKTNAGSIPIRLLGVRGSNLIHYGQPIQLLLPFKNLC